jgi:hypothetical protein
VLCRELIVACMATTVRARSTMSKLSLSPSTSTEFACRMMFSPVVVILEGLTAPAYARHARSSHITEPATTNVQLHS